MRQSNLKLIPGSIAGWGTIYFGGPTSTTVQEVNVRVWDNSECATNYKKLSRDILPTMLCAGESGNDACQVGPGLEPATFSHLRKL